MTHPERSHLEWFEESARYYVQAHQGCPWCGECNCVYKSERGGRQEYQCGNCNFYACHDQGTGRYHMTPGRPRGSSAPKTMHEI
jgi:transposase-like protein